MEAANQESHEPEAGYLSSRGVVMARAICEAQGEAPDDPSLTPGNHFRWQDFSHMAAAADLAVSSIATGAVTAEATETLNMLPEHAPRNDDAYSQLVDLVSVSNRLGMFKASEVLKGLVSIY